MKKSKTSRFNTYKHYLSLFVKLFRFADFFLKIIILKQSDVLRVSDSYKPESSANWFIAVLFRIVRKVFSCLLHRYYHIRLGYEHAYRRSRPCIESQRTETRRNIRKRAKHNRGTCDAMRLAYAHIYSADSAAKSWSYTLDRSGHRDE